MTAARWAKRAVAAVGVTLLLTLVVGATTEQVIRRRVASRFPAAGRLVDVGSGRRLHLDCRGSGSPTVILESGLDYFGSLSWVAVHDSIARTTRVCAYSRPGIMWSDPAPGPFSARSLATDLHTALQRSGEHAPWVMVAHSLGGPYAVTFTQMYDTEVAGVVMLDTTHPDQFPRFEQIAGKPIEPPRTVLWTGSKLAWTGLVRLVTDPHPISWPRDITTVADNFLPLAVSELVREVDAIPATLDEVRLHHSLGERPVVVLTPELGESPEVGAQLGITPAQQEAVHRASRAFNADQATWSTHGRQEIVPGSTHYLQFDRPDVVIRAVREVVAKSALSFKTSIPERDNLRP